MMTRKSPNNIRCVIWALVECFFLLCFLILMYILLPTQVVIHIMLLLMHGRESVVWVTMRNSSNNLSGAICALGGCFFLFFLRVFDTNICFIVYTDCNIHNR